MSKLITAIDRKTKKELPITHDLRWMADKYLCVAKLHKAFEHQEHNKFNKITLRTNGDKEVGCAWIDTSPDITRECLMTTLKAYPNTKLRYSFKYRFMRLLKLI